MGRSSARPLQEVPQRERTALSASSPAGLRSLSPGAGAILELQRSAGNHAVQRMVAAQLQRKPLTAEQKETDLVSARYAGDLDLQAAFDNERLLKRNSAGPAVEKIQHGLIDAGFHPGPRTVAAGMPNAKFDAGTEKAVRAFQAKHKLRRDGIVGRQTLGKLDELAHVEPARPPDIPVTEEALGKHVAAGMALANEGASASSGIWYDYNYFAEHKKDPAAYPWNDDWRYGLASPEYFTRVGWMDWRLRAGKSASAGIKAWLAGLTIAECLATIVAVEIDALRAAIGDDAFDARFGSESSPVHEKERLRITAGVAETPIHGKLTGKTDSGTFGARDVKVGDWAYFYNHPKYLLKHPGGAWQGENAVYLGTNPAGQQLYSGLGATAKTESGLLDEMLGAYNQERDGADYVQLLLTYARTAPEVRTPNRRFLDHDTEYTRGLYEKYKGRIPSKYREESGQFKDTITRDEILSSDPYELDGTTRKGGLIADSIARLNTAEVAKLRPVP